MFSSWVQKLGNKKRLAAFEANKQIMQATYLRAVEIFKKDGVILDAFLLDTEDPTFAPVVRHLKTAGRPELRLPDDHDRWVSGAMEREQLKFFLTHWQSKDGFPPEGPCVLVLAEHGASTFTPNGPKEKKP